MAAVIKISLSERRPCELERQWRETKSRGMLPTAHQINSKILPPKQTGAEIIHRDYRTHSSTPIYLFWFCVYILLRSRENTSKVFWCRKCRAQCPRAESVLLRWHSFIMCTHGVRAARAQFLRFQSF